MSAQPLTPTGPADAIAAMQRVQQLQGMISQIKQGASATSFAAALNAASASSSATPVATASAATAAAALPAATSLPGAAIPPGAATPPAAATPLAVAVPSTGSASSVGSSGSTPYDGAIAQAAARYNLDPAVLHGLIQQESGFDPNSRSSAGALGLTQLMPGTASSLGVSNPLDPVQSIEGGARYLSQMMSQFGGNTEEALAAYNAGPGAVQRYGGVPPYAETQDYVHKVLGYANAYRQSLASTGSPTPTGSIA
ncbi:MAG TPA: lytic transglycosylase domain-containing protein [Solirubrobacteraceae bacterium]|jgi:soluble lytic murein transglycosylase-like protein|nr:lytic transglycosylase domain-containing protein [Solirubrobacteraceae bacterium]